MENYPLKELDIRIRLRIKNSQNYISPRDLIFGLDIIEQSLYNSDLRDISVFRHKYHIPNLYADAAESRLRKFKQKRIALREANTGSIELVCVVLPTALWVLNSTLGEAFKDGFKETQLYNLIKEYSQNEIDEKCNHIVNYLREALQNKKNIENEIVINKDSKNDKLEIEITIDHKKENPPV